MKIENKTTATVVFEGEEVQVFRAVCGLAGFVSQRCADEYKWNGEEKVKVQEILLKLYYGLTGNGPDGPVFKDRRKEA